MQILSTSLRGVSGGRGQLVVVHATKVKGHEQGHVLVAPLAREVTLILRDATPIVVQVSTQATYMLMLKLTNYCLALILHTSKL